MTSAKPTYHLALRDVHAAAGATFATFGGWSLPMAYTGVPAEYEAIRTGAAVFDRSHRSRFLVTGTDALDVLRASFAGHVEDLDEGRAMRTVSLRPDGTIEDVVLVVRTGGIAYLVTGEPSQRLATFSRLAAAIATDFDATVGDRTDSTCLVGLAGPTAAQVVAEQMADALPARLGSLQSVTFQFHGFRGLAVRTSDTGEDGFEFMLAPAVAQHLLETVAPAARLAGFHATEIARVESAIPAFVPDLEPGLSPAEADLDVLLEVPGGADQRVLSALILDGDPIALGSEIAFDGRPSGEIRSCVHSPGLNATIGLGIIDSRDAFPGRQFTAGSVTGTVVAKPFYRRRT